MRDMNSNYDGAPVNVGDEFDVIVEGVGEKGDGIVKKRGFVIFVPGVAKGERVRIRVTKVLKKVGFGEKIGEAQSEPQPDLPSAEGYPEPEPRPVYEDTEDF